MDSLDMKTEATLPDAEVLTKACWRCDHAAVAHQPSNGSCLTCELVGGSCAAARPIEPDEPTVPAFARVSADYEIDGTDDAWRADLGSEQVDENGEVVEVREPGGLAKFIEADTERRYDELARNGFVRVPYKNAGAYEPDREPTQSERDRAYLGMSPAQLAKNDITHGHGGGSKSRGFPPDKPGFKLRRPRAGYGTPELSSTRFNVSGLTRGEAEFYHRRPGVARTVLSGFAQRVIAATSLAIVEGRRYQVAPPAPAPHDRAREKAKRSFEVYGLAEMMIDLLREMPGSARAELIAYAHEQDGPRIRLRDAV